MKDDRRRRDANSGGVQEGFGGKEIEGVERQRTAETASHGFAWLRMCAGESRRDGKARLRDEVTPSAHAQGLSDWRRTPMPSFKVSFKHVLLVPSIDLQPLEAVLCGRSDAHGWDGEKARRAAGMACERRHGEEMGIGRSLGSLNS